MHQPTSKHAHSCMHQWWGSYSCRIDAAAVAARGMLHTLSHSAVALPSPSASLPPASASSAPSCGGAAAASCSPAVAAVTKLKPCVTPRGAAAMQKSRRRTAGAKPAGGQTLSCAACLVHVLAHGTQTPPAQQARVPNERGWCCATLTARKIGVAVQLPACATGLFPEQRPCVALCRQQLQPQRAHVVSAADHGLCIVLTVVQLECAQPCLKCVALVPPAQRTQQATQHCCLEARGAHARRHALGCGCVPFLNHRVPARAPADTPSGRHRCWRHALQLPRQAAAGSRRHGSMAAGKGACEGARTCAPCRW